MRRIKNNAIGKSNGAAIIACVNTVAYPRVAFSQQSHSSAQDGLICSNMVAAIQAINIFIVRVYTIKKYPVNRCRYCQFITAPIS
jgi:hypothetical protein